VPEKAVSYARGVRLGVLILPEHRFPALTEKWSRADGLGFDHAWTYDHPDDARVRDEETVEGIPGLMTDAPQEAPEGFREEPRYEPTVERVYRNDRIEVTWEPAFCIHVAECLRGLPRSSTPGAAPGSLSTAARPMRSQRSCSGVPPAPYTSDAWTAARRRPGPRRRPSSSGTMVRRSCAGRSGSRTLAGMWSGRTLASLCADAADQSTSRSATGPIARSGFDQGRIVRNEEVAMAQEIDREGVRRLIEEGAQVVDVLPAKEYGEDHLPGAINLPLRRIEADARRVLDRDRPIVVYCADSA
jgi:phage shock protein E